MFKNAQSSCIWIITAKDVTFLPIMLPFWHEESLSVSGLMDWKLVPQYKQCSEIEL